MTPPLYVAAGGGGDAIAAWALHTQQWPGVRPIIATFAWDRLLIDPLPGPRSADDFDDLLPIDALNRAFTPDTRPRPPAGSTLPRLAATIDATLALLDPRRGSAGLRAQLRSLVRTTEADRIEIVDVGGDVIAAGTEPTLRSPLADALVLAATSEQDVAVDVHIIGAGLDGELDALTVFDYVRALGGAAAARLDADAARIILPILEWHPSEATALTAAAALGIRGTVEIRDQGHVVELTERSPDVLQVDHAKALAHNAPAHALRDATTLDDAEAAVRSVCGGSEIDYERQKAGRLKNIDAARTSAAAPLATAERYCAEAAQRGVDYVTFRRLAEVAGVDGRESSRLRNSLIESAPDQHVPPLWAVRAHSHA